MLNYQASTKLMIKLLKFNFLLKVVLTNSKAKADEWIKLSATSGKVTEQEVIEVSIDWSKVTNDDVEGVVVLTFGEQEVKVKIEAKVFDASKLESNTNVMAYDYALFQITVNY